jgi:hypothetical protein
MAARQGREKRGFRYTSISARHEMVTAAMMIIGLMLEISIRVDELLHVINCE